MLTIWKFAVPLDKVKDVIAVEMPAVSTILSVGNQDECLCFWAKVDDTSKKIKHYFRVVGTGHPLKDVEQMEEWSELGRFLGTVQFAVGSLVLHVFEVH